MVSFSCYYCFFFNDTATTEIYTLSLHDALPISLVPLVPERHRQHVAEQQQPLPRILLEVRAVLGEEIRHRLVHALDRPLRSEEHTSELQSRQYLVCRLLLEKKKSIVRLPLNLII